jgi:hypothetical protein
MTGFLAVEHNGAQAAPLVLVGARESESHHSTGFDALDAATAHRADLSVYLSTVDPFGSTAPDATAAAVDVSDGGDSALVPTITLTLRSAHEASEEQEAPSDGGTSLNVPHALAGATDAQDADGGASSLDELPPSGPVKRAVDRAGSDGSDVQQAPTVRAAGASASQTVVSPSGRAAAGQNGEEDDPNAALFGPVWPLYLPAPTELMLLPPPNTGRLAAGGKKRRWPSALRARFDHAPPSRDGTRLAQAR